MSASEPPPNWVHLCQHTAKHCSNEQDDLSYDWLHPNSTDPPTPVPKGAHSPPTPITASINDPPLTPPVTQAKEIAGESNYVNTPFVN